MMRLQYWDGGVGLQLNLGNICLMMDRFSTTRRAGHSAGGEFLVFHVNIVVVVVSEPVICSL